MDGRRALLALLLAVPAALGVTLVFAGLTRDNLLLVPVGIALLALAFWGLNRINSRGR